MADRSTEATSRAGTPQAGTDTQARGSTTNQQDGGAAQSAHAGHAAHTANADQERQRSVSRENANLSERGGVQHGARPNPSGRSLAARDEPSLLPALMANPWLMTNAFLANPYGFAQAMSQEMDRLFAPQVADAGAAGRSARVGERTGQGALGSRGPGRWMPQLEVRRRGDDLVVSADLPGLRPEDVDVEIDDGVLTISGERRQADDREEGGYVQSERHYGAFSRSIALPEHVDEEQVRARFEHGVLEVSVPIPKEQRQRTRRVQIQSGNG